MLIALFVAAVACVSAGESFGQNKLREIKDRMDSHNKALQTLRAKITMVKTSSQVGTSDSNTGTALYVRQSARNPLVRIDWQRPAESLSVVDGEYVLFQPKLAIAYKGSASSASKKQQGSSILAVMNMSKAELDANFTIRILNESATLSSGVNTWHLELTPKTKMSYKVAEVWVDKDGMPNQTKVVENNGDTTTVLLTNLEKNVQLKKSNFKIEMPGDTKVQKT